MSHIVTVQTKVHDPAAVASACQRLGLAQPIRGTAELFSGEATGLLLQLPGWQYPAVIDTSSEADLPGNLYLLTRRQESLASLD
jgi:hypothetical protein